MTSGIINSGDRIYIKKMVLDSGKILLKYFGKNLTLKRKQDYSIVTEADKKSEEFLIKNITKRFKESSFLCEESGITSGNSTIRWIIDPLDGTTNFSRGIPRFCISLAMEVENKLTMGVIYNPVTNELFWSELGRGAHLNGVKLKVSKILRLKEAILSTGDSHKDSLREFEMNILKNVYYKTYAVRKTGSAALDLAYIACGKYDGFFHKGINPWDCAAGILLIKEAGGNITNFSGNEYNINDKEIIASNGTHLHVELIDVIGRD